jgi:NADH:ubiquinone oxidoreductase subunit F (NADH-binding)
MTKNIVNNCWMDTGVPSEKLLSTLNIGPLSESDKIEKTLSLFRRENISKPVIFIGAGTCGLGAGAGKTKKAVESYLEDKNIEAEVVEVGCIGLCSAEPLVDIQLPGKTRLSFKNITEEKVDNLLKNVFSDSIPEESLLGQFDSTVLKKWDKLPLIHEHPFFEPQRRWVLVNCGMVNPESIEEYISRGGFGAQFSALTGNTPAGICDTVEKSGLRGRGGGGFPTGRKWKFASANKAEQKYLICNADEGDPGAFMDRAVIEGDPYRLIEGMSIAAYAIGATKAYIYIRAEYPLAIERLKYALEETKKYGFIGKNIFGSGFDLEFVIKMGAGAFVCGEETALIHSIEGKRGMPKPRPPYPAESGLNGCPTIINNVESFANVPMIISKGAEYFASLGTESSRGTKVFALSGNVERTGLVEVPMGTTVEDIVFNIGGGIPGGKKYKAAQIGGPSGGCIPRQHIGIQVDYEKLKEVGAMMGSGGLVVMDEESCMVDVAKFFMDFIQRESCGKCIPCREGTKRMLEILESITRGRREESGEQALERMKGIMNLESLAELIQTTSLCGLGQTAPNPVVSTLHWFKEEYEDHIFERQCPAGVCSGLIEYTIDEKACKGCTLCKKACPTDAVMGKVKAPHYIIP